MRIRTGFSFRTAVGHLEEVASRLKEIGFESWPITDRCSTFGFTKWTKLCKKHGATPIYGTELGVVTELGQKKPTIDYWTFFAVKSLEPLHDLIALATSNPGKEPTITYAQACAAQGLVKMAGLSTDWSLVKDKSVYAPLGPSTTKLSYKAAKAAKRKFVATSDNRFTRESDAAFYEVTMGRLANRQTYPQHIMSGEEWSESVSWLCDNKERAEALARMQALLASCKAKLPKAELLHFKATKTLRQLCLEGAKIKKCDLKNKVYKDRLDRELALISEKKFEDYFYIITDLVQWAKKRMIVGPARGSSCGSLVCYLLDITTIDPIPYGLIFERFIDINREDLPDIDIDFSDQRRDQVFKYAEEKYGADRVARLGTVGMFKPRSALKQAAQELLVPNSLLFPVLDSIIDRSSGDARALQAIEDTLKDTDAGRILLERHPEMLLAGRLEGHPHNSSQHAAGIVITEDPVNKYVAVDMRSGATMCDKKDAEELNLLKIDALGLTQLSTFERVLDLIGEKSVSGWLEKLPTDDPAAFEVLNKQHFAGVFQFAGRALQTLAKQVKINHIEDIIAITALARPGPMMTGGSSNWIQVRTGKKKVSYPHPLFESQLKQTLGVVMYQEQVMQIGREIGNLSWADVTALRKAMSKSLGKEFFDQYGDRWKAEARKKGIPNEVLEKVWDDLCAYGSWAFNRSHAVAYGMVSYWCCYLKAHYPIEFAAATLDNESDPERQILLLRELAAEGIDYVPFDAEVSTDRWMPSKRNGAAVLVGPLQQIHGIGPAAVKEILAARRNGQPIRESLAKKLQSPRTAISTLFPVRDRVAELWPDLKAARIVSRPTAVKHVEPTGSRDDEVMVIGVITKINPRDENEEINVVKRGGKRITSGPTTSLNLFLRDDTDEIFLKIDRFKFESLGREIVERGKAGKALYAIKGNVPNWHFRMISVNSVRYLGDLP